MALKTTNYVVERLEETLPEAYAVIKTMHIDGDMGTAIFAIQKTKDLALNKDAFEEISVGFNIDRTESPYITAYKEAKKAIQKEIDIGNGQKRTITIKGPLYGWDDEILY